MKIKNIYLWVGLLFCLLASCEEPIFTPKPRGFPRVDFPAKSYQPFDKNYCRFVFDYPTYAQIQQDTNFFQEKPANPCWFDVVFPAFDGRIHCSYYPIRTRKDFDKHTEDAFKLAGKHNVKANFIDELRVEKPNHVSGFVFDIDGPAASPFQFYLTDSTHHFLRGAVYFNTQSRPDSMAPVLDFIKKDVMQIINTFEWR